MNNKQTKQNVKVLAEQGIPMATGPTMPGMTNGGDQPIIWINDFNEEETRDFFEKFQSLESDDQVHAILIYIDSYGGSLDSLSAICELMSSSRKQIVTAAVGKAMSAGAMMVSLGAEGMRFAGPTTTLMYHRVQIQDIDGDINLVHSMSEAIMKENEAWLRRIIARTKMTWKGFNKELNERGGAWYMTSKEALHHGFIDKIGIPAIRTIQQTRLYM